MWNVSNVLSALRLRWRLLFSVKIKRCDAWLLLRQCSQIALMAILLVVFRNTSQLGAVLDPFTDKFFVVFLFVTFIIEGSLTPWQMLAMLGVTLLC